MRTLEREVLFDFLHCRSIWIGLTLGVVGYSAGHAGLALSAGALAQAIGRTPLSHDSIGPLDGIAWLGRWSDSLSALSYVGLASALVKAAAGARLARAETELGAAVAGRLRLDVVRQLLNEGFPLPAPRMLALLAVRIREVEAAVTRGVVTGLRSISQLVPLGACLVALSPQLALAAAFVVTPFAVLLTAMRGRSRQASERAQTQMEELECGVDELVRNADLFRTYGAGADVVAAVERSGNAAAASTAHVETMRAALSGANEVMGALAVVGALALARHFGVEDRTPVLLPFAAVFFMAYRPLRDLGDARGWIGRGTVALSALPPPVGAGPQRSRARSFVEGRAPIADLRGVGAANRGPRTTCRLDNGEIVCLVGPTGSGKTTLFRVLLGLEAAAGVLCIDGVDATNAPSGPAARPFAWVPQDAPLVTGTLHDNVLLMGGTAAAADAALDVVGARRAAAPEENRRTRRPRLVRW